ncbi:MAG: hypothetical protein AB7F59_11340 [Bdellovibrionales bacterium]
MSSFNRIIPVIETSNGQLILAETFLCDESLPLAIRIPTTSGEDYRFLFEFLPGETFFNPEHETHASVNQLLIKVKLGSKNGNFLSLNQSVDTNISGKKYSVLFSITRVIGKTIRIELSLFEKRGLL